jgi:hypothetical protein
MLLRHKCAFPRISKYQENYFSMHFIYSANLLLVPKAWAELPNAHDLVSFAGNPNWKGKYFTSGTYRQRVVSA